MSTIPSLSTSALSPRISAAPSRPAAAEQPRGAAATADRVSLSPEAKASLAEGRPFFAVADGAAAEGTATEGRAKEALQAQSDAVAGRTKRHAEQQLKQEEATKARSELQARQEKHRKAAHLDRRKGTLAGQEEATKGRAGQQVDGILDRAKEQGVELPADRLDGISARLKEEAARKGGLLDDVQARGGIQEKRHKARHVRHIDRRTGHMEEQQQKTAGRGQMQLSRLEERMKALDRKVDPGAEEKEKAAQPAPVEASPQEPAPTEPATHTADRA